MTSFRLSELPTPGVTAGFPAGCTLAEAQPTGKVYFSGASVDVTRQDAWYMFAFDPADGSNISDLAAKQVGDELSVTINGTTQMIAVVNRQSDVDYTNLVIGMNAPEVPLIMANMWYDDDVWSFNQIMYISAEDIPGGVTMTIADPA